MLDKVVADQIVIISIPYSMIHSGHNHHVEPFIRFHLGVGQSESRRRMYIFIDVSGDQH